MGTNLEISCSNQANASPRDASRFDAVQLNTSFCRPVQKILVSFHIHIFIYRFEPQKLGGYTIKSLVFIRCQDLRK